MNQLAINGGNPVRPTLLPYGQQWIDEEDIQSVLDVLRGELITQGPKIAEFEQKVAKYAGTKYAVAFSSGTAALHGACFAAGIGPGDEVITSAITFAASSNCVLYQGGTPVFADINPLTYNIDPQDIRAKLSSRTKAIIPVDFTGQPVEMDEIRQIANEHNLIIIEDAAHSIGATYKGRKVGTLADMTMFSFHPVKHVTTAEGGVIVTNNEDFYYRMQLFRSHGITKDPSLLTHNEGPWYYEMQELGYHYRMPDMQAALGITQMDKLDRFVARRREIASYYQSELSGLPGITLPRQHEDTSSSWHLFILRFDLSKSKLSRKEIFEAFRAENIGVNVHYLPVYLHPYYEKLGYTKGICPEAETLYKEIITIPLFPRMTTKDMEDVVGAVRKIQNETF
ncbi:UDP-4-amino-4,6-dideoxy-N-acetyl-beta-L-altrosamine transaminase [Paenibacillus andongensis]|uniref:UDP-4-amino-4, 6-dideoxy-N-acetyl-beta-L-altrosamine transaminase n=1 Tax=Paenibacillus andongensis TaxID=2975482 RepID=UPI0021BA4EC6|nr:UDP-4-amino-4,6-dideoxy-N-acetyl-beta-L-altrosamine transaminase [Paenibacillus andongensis]